MSEILINYEDLFSKWKAEIITEIDNHSINAYSIGQVNTLIDAIRDKAKEYLKEHDLYMIDDMTSNRRRLCKELNKWGLKLQIKSNSLLWKFLEYFTDLPSIDYKLCFDVDVVIIDIMQVNKNLSKLKIHKIPTSELYLKEAVDHSANDLIEKIENLAKDINNLPSYKLKEILNSMLVLIETILKRRYL